MKVHAAIVGGQKCGTTTLFHALARHPDVLAARAEESRAFALPDAERDRVLESLFPQGDGKRLLAYAHAWAYPDMLRAMHRHNPDMRLVALTRDPVERIWSAWRFAVRNGWETLALPDALAAEAGRRTGTRIEATELQYVANSHYDALTAQVTQVFGRDALLVLPLNQLEDASGAALAPIFRHLGLPEVPLPPMPARNTASKTRWPLLHRLLLGESLPKRWVRRALPPSIKARVHERLTHPLLRANTVPVPSGPVPEDARTTILHALECPP